MMRFESSGVRRHRQRALMVLATIGLCVAATATAVTRAPFTGHSGAEHRHVPRHAPASPKESSASDKLFDALARGNADTVKRLAHEMGLNSVWRQLLDAQLHGDMMALLNAAARCREQAFAAHARHIGQWCGATAVGAAWQLGDPKRLFGQIAQLKKHGAMPHKNRGPFVDNAPKLAHALPETTVDITAGSGSIPLVERAEPDDAPHTTNWNTPQVAIMANGHTLKADVDTGSAMALTMDASHAKGLGIKTLATGLTAVPTLNVRKTQKGNATLGLLRRFKLGPMTIRNLAVMVVPDGYAASGVLIGWPVLAHFEQVTFRDKSITVSMDKTSCAHPIPETYAANTTRQLGQFVFRAEVDGAPVSAMFDSGASPLLAARPGLAADRRGEAADARPPRSGYLSVSLGHGHIASYSAAFDAQLPDSMPDVLIGIPLVATADVAVRYSPPSLCIIPTDTAGKQ
jgi:predicted aspartyl protease